MKIEPKYADNIIVGVKYNNAFNWYVSDKELWYLDLRKLVKAYESKGFKIPNPDDFSDRFNMDIVNEYNVKEFLGHISTFLVKSDELTGMIINKGYRHISDVIPSIYIDFDKKILISNFPEPASYEEFVPNDWKGEYNSFDELIPANQRYWIYEDNNFLEEL